MYNEQINMLINAFLNPTDEIRSKLKMEDFNRAMQLYDIYDVARQLDYQNKYRGAYMLSDMDVKDVLQYVDDPDVPEDADEDTILEAYANNIYNYLYNYKDEATAIDPSIDPQEEQIGPMAQDIEKVNPACVKETPEGVKEVDTGRLALMNAGAIADLAREMETMLQRLKALEGDK